MKAVIQRVKSASVKINGNEERFISEGLLILLGIAQTDTEALCDKVCEKCAQLRIFEDDSGKLNLSAAELSRAVLLVSNFTLCADTKKRKRPSFDKAAKQPMSVQLYKRFAQRLPLYGIADVKTGEFGAEMQVSLVNDGPVTIVIDTDEWERTK